MPIKVDNDTQDNILLDEKKIWAGFTWLWYMTLLL